MVLNRAKVLKLAKGYTGRNKNCLTIARPRVEKGLQYQYRDRRVKKRDNRALWIQQINAATRQYQLPYSTFAHGLALSGCSLNRKMLSELAINEPYSFKAITDFVKDSLAANNFPPRIPSTTPPKYTESKLDLLD